jgi:hypothetical protein
MAAGDYPSPYAVTKVAASNAPITFVPASGLALGDVRWLWSFRLNSSAYLRFIGIEFFFDNGVRTTLANSAAIGATTVDLVDASAFPTSTADGALNPGQRHCGVGNTGLTGTEATEKNHFTYTGKTGNTLTGVAGWASGTGTFNAGSTVAYGDVGAYINGGSNIEFHYCDFHHASESNIFPATSVTDLHFVNCILRDAGTREDPRHQRDHGAYFNGDNNLLLNCVIRDNDAHAFQLYSSGSGRLVINCTIDGNGIQHASNLAAMTIAGTASAERIINCLVTNNGGVGSNSTAGTGHILKYPLFFGNDGADQSGTTGITYTAHPDNSEDPLYVNQPSKDFSLQSGSPALASADGAWAPQFDFNNDLRPATASVGAFESSGGTTEAQFSWTEIEVPLEGAGTATTRDVRVTGTADTNRTQDVRVTGYLDSSTTRDVRARGSADSSRAQDVRATGQQTTTESRDVRVRGQADSTTNRDVRITGAADSNATRDVRVTGQLGSERAQDVRTRGTATSTVERDARVVGTVPGEVTHAVDARVRGTATSTDTRDVRVFASIPADTSRDVRARGQAVLDAVRDIRIVAQADSTIVRDVRLRGQLSSDTSRDARTTGKADSSTETNVRVTGTIATSVDYAARVTGKADSDTTRDVYVRGQLDSTVLRDVRVTGQDEAAWAQDVRTQGQADLARTQDVRVTGYLPAAYEVDARVIGAEGYIDIAFDVRVAGGNIPVWVRPGPSETRVGHGRGVSGIDNTLSEAGIVTSRGQSETL